jgi:hypothetical protein
MKNIWKLATVVLFITCLSLGYFIYKEKFSIRENGTISLNEINKEDFEYKKKQNPIFAEDNNDYFFQNPTTIKFFQDEYDFDTIALNKVITKDIKFINTGEKPYFITDIKVSCVCTVPSYDNKPIAAGDTGRVTVKFNSSGKNGFIMNKLSVFGNTNPKERSVYFKIYVK